MGQNLHGVIEVLEDGVWGKASELPVLRECGWGDHLFSFLCSASNHRDIKPLKRPNGLPDDWGDSNERSCINVDGEEDSLLFDHGVGGITTYELSELLNFNYDQGLIYEDMDIDPITHEWVPLGTVRVCKTWTYRDWLSNEYNEFSTLYFDRLAEYAKLLETYDNVRLVVGYS